VGFGLAIRRQASNDLGVLALAVRLKGNAADVAMSRVHSLRA
jgi:hypothetical protein